MSRQNLAVPLMGAAALVGGGVYYMRQPSNTSGDPAQQIANTDKRRPTSDETTSDKATESRKRAADAKRDNGLGGAGVGFNNNTGGAELSSGNQSGTSADGRGAPKGPKEKFPNDAGQVGGGYGSGNANTRAVETHGPSMTPGSSTATGAVGGGKSSGGGGGGGDAASSSNSSGIGSKLQGFFGTGGGQGGEKVRQAPVDTKIASNHADTPTKKGGSPWDKHRRDVTAVSDTES
ncbi:uncharacterized protein LY79DRAFT_519508 [Colletotrichum navitas]|uniref:Uncharacterized protein n=1 Tax=Colletotrichum navitas TaxID=681940 RepID=A0AAD8PVN4_9PEZI|nr:uncharacterized protein LY79DRAFT_519508 [Colletotrichum navitas]KAK1585073.1 hypothetical protein LY79DRAFT_519508 [Colletotrichum navitas]